MAVAEVTMYRIVCDHEGCTNSPQDGGEYYAYADQDAPLAEAEDADWYIVHGKTEAGEWEQATEGVNTRTLVITPPTHLCPDHQPQCKNEDCGAFLRDDEFGPYCEDHAEDRTDDRGSASIGEREATVGAHTAGSAEGRSD